MLKASGLDVHYARIKALSSFSIEVGRGEAVALLGANGAGKTTAVEAMAGLLPYSGRLEFDGRDISGYSADRAVKAGLALVPQWRELFPGFTVAETLEIASNGAGDRTPVALQEVFALFPKLEERRGQIASSLSGGEQQMLAIGRALVTNPKMIIFDEPSAGLAVGIVRSLIGAINRIRERGVAILLVEQNLEIAKSVASQCTVLSAGRVAWSGAFEDAMNSDLVKSAYFA